MAPLAALPYVVVNPAAHAREHSLEVQLPFLQRVLPAFTLVPLVVGQASPAEVASVIETLWGGEETLVVISTDLSHYLPYELARSADQATAQAILSRDTTLAPDRACGAAGLRGLLQVARRRDLAITQLDLRNSGDTAGDPSRVVGYGAFACYEGIRP
jgi:AmmeMemoRadiSam system protein B